jgi:hypothetical protein
MNVYRDTSTKWRPGQTLCHAIHEHTSTCVVSVRGRADLVQKQIGLISYIPSPNTETKESRIHRLITRVTLEKSLWSKLLGIFIMLWVSTDSPIL